MKNDLIAARGVCLANTSYLRDFFKLKKVPVYLNSKVKEITDKGIIATGKDGKEIEIEGDAVITCVGYVSAPLDGKKGNLVGDCYEVGNVMTVVRRAWDVAMKK